MKKLAIDRVQNLRNTEERRKIIFKSVLESSRIEGIVLSPEAQKRVQERVSKRLKKQAQ